MTDEKSILEQFAAGNHTAFRELFMRYHLKVYYFVLGLVKSESDAEDLTQEIFLKLWTHRSRFTEVRTFGSYLYVLYKTDIDREQWKEVSDKEPEIYERMKRYSNWFKDELLVDFPKKDTRPFIIGHPQETCSKLPARDARISGPIERSNRYPNCSYFTNWKSPEAEISWNVEVEESGLFEAFVYYTCDRRNIGSTFELRTDRDAENLVFTLDQVNDQPRLGADLDRVLREESYVKGFAPCSVGTIPLSKGAATLSLQAKTIRNEEAMNFWMLVLKRVK